MKKVKSKGKADVKPRNKMYFTSDTEKAIIRYNLLTDDDERNKLYKEEIEYPLDKLAENIINRFKFPYVHHNFEDTKRQVVSFLVINLAKFTEDKGKAFSYFSVIAKNYLIHHNNIGYKHEKRSVYLSEKTDSEIPIEEILQLQTETNEEQEDIQEFFKLEVEYWENNVARVFKKKRDIDIANSVIELIRKVDTIENFNKKALYLLIREMTDQKTSYITKVINKMKDVMKDHWLEYQEHGLINLKESQFFTYKK